MQEARNPRQAWQFYKIKLHQDSIATDLEKNKTRQERSLSLVPVWAYPHKPRSIFSGNQEIQRQVSSLF
jgi:hypothetical protein